MVMNNPYHGILLDLEFKDKEFLKRFKILGKKKSSENPWFLFRVEVPAEELEKIIGETQDQMVEGAYYCHFYRDNELIVIFKEKIFKVTPDKSTWDEIINYGLSLGIPEKQLSMSPCRFEDETY